MTLPKQEVVPEKGEAGTSGSESRKLPDALHHGGGGGGGEWGGKYCLETEHPAKQGPLRLVMAALPGPSP